MHALLTYTVHVWQMSGRSYGAKGNNIAVNTIILTPALLIILSKASQTFFLPVPEHYNSRASIKKYCSINHVLVSKTKHQYNIILGTN